MLSAGALETLPGSFWVPGRASASGGPCMSLRGSKLWSWVAEGPDLPPLYHSIPASSAFLPNALSPALDPGQTPRSLLTQAGVQKS